jgi:hypothetical protein
VIALTDDRGRLLRVSAARPGRTSQITACRHDQLTQKLRAAGLGAIADVGFVGLDDSGPDADPAVITGYKAARNPSDTRSETLQQGPRRRPGAGRARLRPPEDLTVPRQGPHRPEVGDRPGQGPAFPHLPRSLPVTDDLHHNHSPATSMSTSNTAHTRLVTCNFTMHSAHCSSVSRHMRPLVVIEAGNRWPARRR